MSAVMNPAETFRRMRTALKAANACTMYAARDPDAARRTIKHMRLALSAAAELERLGVLALLQARLATSDPGPRRRNTACWPVPPDRLGDLAPRRMPNSVIEFHCLRAGNRRPTA